ncbi:Calcineurin-like phosphoesterase [Novipirellula galeiformis]|uniref:Calcineurin-like phosphoesterase n=1 Tax=Novipirellula galeiformis TaxID=2528004 RepID=A0A5C6CPH6_9BACT|nr:ligase-associated DNA damage response endonuclease PdeM [Novipirellula galeiformis]TWU26298.1 Calcineurin-like phosphoesterase [Novipirellula galeiformis]
MHVDITVGQTRLRLLARRAIYWSQLQTLFVADTHFGKDATFRRHGIPVPTGSTAATLSILSQMLATTSAKHLVILGDMFHARSSLSEEVCDALSSFFARHAELRRTLVRGNHDAHLGPLPEAWSLEVVEPGTRMGNVALGHQPTTVPEDADLLLCGHLHPALSIGRGKDKLGKLPCFWLSKRCLVLPALGQFTGTYAIEMAANDRAWVVADEQLIELAPPLDDIR